MANKTFKNSMVTREQYDKLQVDVVDRIEAVEAKEAYDSKDIRGQVARANTRLYAEIRALQERQANLEKKATYQQVLWGMTTIFAIVSVLILAAN